MKAYADKLRDPRWQRRRLEIFNRDDWRCRRCGDHTQELHVHHTSYRRNPWDALDSELETVCKPCHDNEHNPDHVAPMEWWEEEIEAGEAFMLDNLQVFRAAHGQDGQAVTGTALVVSFSAESQQDGLPPGWTVSIDGTPYDPEPGQVIHAGLDTDRAKDVLNQALKAGSM